MGLITFFGLGLAGITQPLVGMLSDRIASLWNRILWIMGVGALMLTLSLEFLLASTAILPISLLFGAVQVSLSTIQAPGQSLLPSLIPKGLRGRASGIKSALEILSAMVAATILVQLVARGTPSIAMLIIVTTLFLSVGVMLFASRNVDEKFIKFGETSDASISDGLKRKPGLELLWWMINRGLFWMPIVAIRNLLVFYLQDVKGLVDPLMSSANVIAAIAITVIVVSLPSGYLTDCIGRVRLIMVGVLASIIGTVLLLLEQNQPQLLLAGIFLGSGVGSFLSASWALVTDIVPRSRESEALAIGNLATIIASATGRLWGPVVDLLNNLLGKNNGYSLALFFAIACFAGNLLTLIPLGKSLESKTIASEDH